MTVEVRIGQKYRTTTGPREVWEVVSILSDTGPIPHARLRREGSLKDTKTVSIPALQDRKLYQLVE